MRVGRVVLFFFTAFGSICFPVLGMFLYTALTYAPPYEIDIFTIGDLSSWRRAMLALPEVKTVEEVDMSKHVQLKEALKVQFSSGGRVLLLHFPEASDPKDFLHPIQFDIPTNRVMSTEHTVYQRSDDQYQGVLFISGQWLIISEAQTKDGRFEQLAGLPGFVAQQMNAIDSGGATTFKMVFVVIGIYCLVLLFTWPRMASWAATVEKKPGISPVPADELYDRLLALNNEDIPYVIEKGKKAGELIATYKYADVKWFGAMHAAGLTSTMTIRMRLDKHGARVRAQDIKQELAWNVGAAGTLSAHAKISWFRGIVFAQYDRGFVGGLVLQKDGKMTLDTAYSWKFSQQEMRNPLVELVTQSGWQWRPVVSFIRLFG